MATSLPMPLNCPACGFVFGLLAIANVEAHMVAHILTFMQLGLANSRDASTDW
jgi:hypothetical protein